MKVYGIALSVFLVIDLIWLGFIAKRFYADQIGFLLKTNVNWIAALFFYALFIAGLVFFVINPAIEQKSLQYAIFAGAFFGLLTYATYDLTNLATLKDWPVLVTIVDMMWGTILAASVSGITYTIIERF